MSVYKSKKSLFYQYDFQIDGHRFYGSAECTARKDAEKFEVVERERAKAMKHSAASLLIDDVAARLWNDEAQYDAAPKATSKNIARLVDYFGKAKSLTDIDHNEAKKMVAWRRGHRIKGREHAALISNATVNRSATKVLQRLQGRRRHAEFVGGEFRHASDCEVGEGRQARGVPHHRHHPRNSFPVAGSAPRLRVHLRGNLRQQATRQGARPALPAHAQRARSAWQRMRAKSGVKDFRFHDYRHDFGTKAIAGNRQPQAGAEGAEPPRHQEHAAISPCLG